MTVYALLQGVCALYGAVQDELDSISAEALREAMDRRRSPSQQASPGGGVAMDADDLDSRRQPGGNEVRPVLISEM